MTINLLYLTSKMCIPIFFLSTWKILSTTSSTCTTTWKQWTFFEKLWKRVFLVSCLEVVFFSIWIYFYVKHSTYQSFQTIFNLLCDLSHWKIECLKLEMKAKQAGLKLKCFCSVRFAEAQEASDRVDAEGRTGDAWREGAAEKGKGLPHLGFSILPEPCGNPGWAWLQQNGWHPSRS